MLFLFVNFFLNFTSKSHQILSVNGRVLLIFLLLDSSNKLNRISALLFKQIYILSPPIIHKLLWSVVVLTVSPVKLYEEGELKIQQKSTEIS